MLPFERLNITQAPHWHFCEVGWHWSPPPLPHFALWFVHSGRGELLLNDETFVLSNGTCFIFEPHSRPIASHNPLYPLRIFSCNFTLEKWDTSPLWLDGDLVYDNSIFVLSAQKSQNFYQRSDSVGRELARRGIEQLVLGLWDTAHQPPITDQENELDELAEAIRREPARAWNLDDMSHSLHLSRAHFVRCFRARFAISPMSFVAQIRLERAKKLLLESNLTLDSIAHSVGYSDAPFLSKNFKTAFGESPGAWRKREKISKKNSHFVIDNPKESL